VKKTSKRTGASRKRSPRRPAETALGAFAVLAKRAKLRWFVLGAQAVNLHGVPRLTADLDVTVALDERTIDDLIELLARGGFVTEEDAAFAAVNRVLPVVHTRSKFPVDVVIAGPGLEERFLDEVEHHRLGRSTIPVIGIENLIAMKVLAGRPKDIEDVRGLLRKPVDHERVRGLLRELEEALDQSDLLPRYGVLVKESGA
jgi:hypothetical protein